MAKRKDSLALFEVIGKDKKQQAASALPGWVKPPAVADGASSGSPQTPTDDSTVPGEPSADNASAQGASASGIPMGKLFSAERIITSGDGQARVSLNMLGWAAVGCVLVVLLAGAFVAGRMSATPKALPAGPGAGDVDGEKLFSGGNGSNAPAGSERIEGKYYLVIQGFRDMSDKHKADARAVKKYLDEQNVPATVNEYAGTPPQRADRQYIVWSLVPFDSDKSTDAIEYARKMEELARAHKVPGGYNFKQGESPWFLREPKAK